MKLLIYLIYAISLMGVIHGMDKATAACTPVSQSQRNAENIHYLQLFMEMTAHEGKTANLTEAIIRNRVIIFKKMLASGKYDVNEQDDLGWTPLMLAIYCKNIDIITILLCNPLIDLTLQDSSGKDAYAWAEQCHLKAVKKMLKAGTK